VEGSLMARILFDLDGTLVDSAPTLASASNALLAELGRPPLSEDTVKRFVGHGMGRLIERVLGVSGGVPEAGFAACLARYREIYFADPVTGTEPYSGVREALAELAAAGHGLAVCTQKPRLPSRMILERLRLMPPVTGLTAGDDLGVLKPDPAMVRHAAAQIGAGEVIYVGDSETDSATAEAAGVPFLLHAKGYCHVPLESLTAVAIFESFTEVPGLVRQVLESRAAS
jgi:phosphoglycolate phosphatase